jgi:hypothetical protein
MSEIGNMTLVVGLGRSTTRFGGSKPCIVKVEQQFSFALLGKWIYH